MAIPIRNKESITVRNAIAQVIIHYYTELIQSDNGEEFTNKTLNAYLEGINAKHLYQSLYYPQSQGAIEAFIKTVQKSLSAAYYNAKDEKLDWDLEINLFNVAHFYNCKRENTTAGQIPKYVLDNFNNAKIREIVIITIENLDKNIKKITYIKSMKK